MHSQIERSMHVAEFYSPISFISVLLKANRHNPFKVIKMSRTDFKNI